MTTIESNVPVPEANKKAAKRGRKIKEKNNGAAGLLKSLQFVALAQRSAGVAYQTHCLMNNRWLVAADGVLTMGCRIEEDISACPKTDYLLSALQKCGEQVAIAQLNEFTLSIKSGGFKATIPCVDFTAIHATAPDPLATAASDDLRAGFESLAWLIREGEERAHMASLLLQSETMVGTNGHVLLERWHGLNLPQAVLIPKAAVTALSKIAKPLTGYGCSNNSATFYFEDGSFLKTQLFDARYPNYQSIFQDFVNQAPTHLPANFLEGIKAVQDFCTNKLVVLCGDKIQSNLDPDIGASFALDGIPNDICFNYEYLNGVAAHFQNTIFLKDRVSFHNNTTKTRGCVMAAVWNKDE